LRNNNIILDYESIKSFIGIDYSGFSDRVKTIIDSGRSDCITYLIEYASKGLENDPNSGFYKSILSILFKFKSKMDNKNKMLIDSTKDLLKI
jgi:hypothetical protein